ncbi:reverse transcriptase domain-containing protein, partial [Tanacetum coccineum]
LFKESPHPDEKQRQQLSKRLGLHPRQAIQERHENSLLKSEMDKLRDENKLLIETIKNDIEKLRTSMGKYPQGISPTNTCSTGNDHENKSTLDLCSGVFRLEKSRIMEIINIAMEELFPVETRSSRCIEASRDSGVVFVDLSRLQQYKEMFPCMIAKEANLDVICNGEGANRNGAVQLQQYKEMFPCMIAKAATLDVICNGEGANRNVKKVDIDRIYKRQDNESIVILSNLGYSSSRGVLNCNTYEVATACALALGAEKLICIIDGPILDEWSQFGIVGIPARRDVASEEHGAQDVFVKVGKFHFSTDFVVIDYDVDPWVPLILRRLFLRMARALIDVHGEELTLRVNDEAITFNVEHTLRYSYIYDDELVNRIDVIDVTCEEYAQEDGLNDDPSSPLPPKELHFEKLKMIKSYIDDPPELELKDLPYHLEYAFFEGTNKLHVIIAKNLKDEEKARLLKILMSHKRAIAWKIFDIKGIDPQFCTHKILMEDDFKPAVQHQRRVNPKIHEVIKKEVIKLLDAD